MLHTSLVFHVVSYYNTPYLVIAPGHSVYLLISVVNKHLFLIFKTETNISNSHLIPI